MTNKNEFIQVVDKFNKNIYECTDVCSTVLKFKHYYLRSIYFVIY